MKYALTVAVIFLLLSCGEKEEALGNGYKIIELSKNNMAIVKSNGSFVVYPNVDRFSTFGDMVIGHRSLAVDNADENDNSFGSGLGYFIFSTRTGRLREGLSKEQLRTAGYGGI